MLVSSYRRFELVSVQLAEIVVVGRQTKLQRLSQGLGCNRLTTLSCSLVQDLATGGTARGYMVSEFRVQARRKAPLGQGAESGL